MKKQFKKIVAALLCFAMLLTSVPSYAYFTIFGTPDFIVDEAWSFIDEGGGIQIGAHSYNELDITDTESYQIFVGELCSFIKVDEAEYEIGNDNDADQEDLINKYNKVDSSTDLTVNDDWTGYTYINDASKFKLQTATSSVFDDPSDETTTKGKITYTITNTDSQSRQFNFANMGVGEATDNYFYKKDNNKICIVAGANGSDSYRLKTTLTMDEAPNTRFVGPATTNEEGGWFFDANRYLDSTANEYGSLDGTYAAFCSSWTFDLEANESKTITINYEVSKENKCTLTFKDLKGNIKTVDTFKGELLTLEQIAKEDFEEGKNVRWKDTNTNRLYTSNDIVRVNGNTSFIEVKYEDETTPNRKHKMAIMENIKGLSSMVIYDGTPYEYCPIDFEYEAGDEVAFFLDSFVQFDKVKVYPSGDVINIDDGHFTIESLPDCDILIEPIISLEVNLYINFEKKNDNNFPDVVCNQCDFEVEWLNTNGETTTFEYNTPYAAHIIINGDPDNGGIDYNDFELIVFNETMFSYMPMGISEITLHGPDDEEDVLESYYGWYYDYDTKKIHVYMHYACLDSLKLYLDNYFVDGNSDDTNMHFDKPEFACLADAMLIDDIPDTIPEGYKTTVMAMYSYDSIDMGNDMGIVDVNKFEVLEGENSHFKVSPYKKNDADDFIIDLIAKYDNPMAILFSNPKSISGNYINKNSYALIAIFDIEVTNNKSTPSSGGSSSKTYKAKDTNDTAEKVSGSGKKGSTRTITPIEGKKVSSVIVTDKDGNKVDVTLNEDGTYSFKQPASDVTIEVNYKNREITLNIGSTEAVVDGEKSNLDVCPVVRNDRTMLPIRYVAENLGAKVEWNEKKPDYVAITRGDTKIEITLGSDVMLVNGKEVKLDSVAFAENDRTYLPVRAISEALNAIVEWNEERPTEVKIYER